MLLSLAFADVPPVVHGNYLLSTGRPAEAAAVAARVLDADADDLAAIRLYAGSRTMLGDGPTLLQIFRGWNAGEPAAPAAVGLAWTLFSSSDPGDKSWCEEAVTALDAVVLSDDERETVELNRTRFTVARACGGNGMAVRSALEGVPGSYAHGQRLLYAARGPLVPSGAEGVAGVFVDAPWRMDEVAGIFSKRANGPGVGATRRVVLKAARAFSESEEPAVLDACETVFRRADKDREAKQVRERLEALDAGAAGTSGRNPKLLAMRKTRSEPDPAVGLANLEAFESELDGDLERAYFETTKASFLETLGKKEEALKALFAAAEAQPSVPVRARVAARKAVEFGEGLERALELLESALAVEEVPLWTPQLPPRRRVMLPTAVQTNPVPTHYAGWRVAMAARAAEDRVVAGQLLAALGRTTEARRSFTDAVWMADTASTHLALGLFLLESDPDDAVRHLFRGLALDEEHALAADAQAALGMHAVEQGHWAPGGPSTWVQAVRAAEPESAAATSSVGAAHPLLGEEFPVTSWRSEGEVVTLASLAGSIVVIDLWATWCGPCVESMPHLDEVAREFTDVVVVAVSVDRQERSASRFQSKAPDRAFAYGYAGPDAMRQAKVSGIPAQFVIDGEGRVAAFFSGYGGPNDTRLEDTIKALKAEQPAD